MPSSRSFFCVDLMPRQLRFLFIVYSHCQVIRYSNARGRRTSQGSVAFMFTQVYTPHSGLGSVLIHYWRHCTGGSVLKPVIEDILYLSLNKSVGLWVLQNMSMKHKITPTDVLFLPVSSPLASRVYSERRSHQVPSWMFYANYHVVMSQ